jgi:hypothetical protein
MPLNELDVTRLPGGLSTQNVNNIFSSFGMPDPTKYHTYFNDFDLYTAGDWTVTETQAGATQALIDGDGGVLALVNSAANNDLNSIQKAFEGFRLELGKRTFMKARFKVDDATNAAVVVGLCITDTTPLDVTDGLYFYKAAATTSISVFAEKNNTSTSAVAGTMASDTYTTVGLYFDGIDRIWYMFGDAVVGYITPSTNLCDDEDLTITLSVANGTAAARTLTVDYILVAKAR